MILVNRKLASTVKLHSLAVFRQLQRGYQASSLRFCSAQRLRCAAAILARAAALMSFSILCNANGNTSPPA